MDLDTGQYITDLDPVNYDQRKASKDPKLSIALTPDQDIAKSNDVKYATDTCQR